MELVERVHFYGAKISMELIGIFPEGYTVSDGCSIMGWATGHEITREAMEAVQGGLCGTGCCRSGGLRLRCHSDSLQATLSRWHSFSPP